MVEQDPIPALKEHVAHVIRAELARHYAPGAALLMRTDLPRVSDLRRGRLERFSLETLIRYATRLGLDIELSCNRSGLKERSEAGPDR
jgi:predicted XRE-type DNA-binding protein